MRCSKCVSTCHNIFTENVNNIYSDEYMYNYINETIVYLESPVLF